MFKSLGSFLDKVSYSHQAFVCLIKKMIVTNIPQWLKTGFVVQGHIYFWSNKYKNISLRHNSHVDQHSVRLHAQYTAYC